MPNIQLHGVRWKDLSERVRLSIDAANESGTSLPLKIEEDSKIKEDSKKQRNRYKEIANLLKNHTEIAKGASSSSSRQDKKKMIRLSDKANADEETKASKYEAPAAKQAILPSKDSSFPSAAKSDSQPDSVKKSRSGTNKRKRRRRNNPAERTWLR